MSDKSQNVRSSLLVCCLACLPVLVLCIWLAWVLYEYGAFGYEGRVITVTGRVIDKDTGDPITRAHVIVSFFRMTFMTGERQLIGIVTNEEGDFTLEYESTFPLRGIDVEASSPDNKYASVCIEKFDDLNRVEVQVDELPAWFLNDESMQYDRFTGDLVPYKGQDSTGSISFIGEGW